MKKSTRNKLKSFLKNFVISIGETSYSVEELKRAFPFHVLFFPDEALISFKLQRRIVTKMGMKLYPGVAKIIAEDRYEEVRLNHPISGELDTAKATAIERIITELRSGKRSPNMFEEMEEISRASGGGAREIKIIADLFVGDFKPGPLFLEIKSPRPNLDVCAESKKKMLFFRALYMDRNPQAFLAFPYNPFIRREDYEHGPTMRIMDMDNEVLIGEEMWDKIGGRGTYDEILEVIEEVKEELREMRRAR